MGVRSQQTIFSDTGLCAHASLFDLLGSAGATVDLFSDSGVVIISSSSALSLATRHTEVVNFHGSE